MHVTACAGAAPGSPVDPAQRGVALRCLAGACCSGQLLVDLFVNYDCDLEGANLFERLVLALVRTAQAAPGAIDASTAAHLRLLVRAHTPLSGHLPQTIAPCIVLHALMRRWEAALSEARSARWPSYGWTYHVASI